MLYYDGFVNPCFAILRCITPLPKVIIVKVLNTFFVFVWKLGPEYLALSTAVVAFLNCSILYITITRISHGLDNLKLGRTLLRLVLPLGALAGICILAGHTVLPTERPQQVATMLADVPLPPGFDVSALASADRALDDYQLVAEVTGAVWCEWASRWDAALTAGDDAAAHTAAAAIASSTGWRALLAIDSKGGWSSVVWEYSARVADGDRSVVADSKGGLGCSSG